MMSSLSIASRSPGSDAMLFMTIGTLDTNTDPSFANPDKGQHKVRRRDNHNKNADIGKLDAIDGEAEEDNDDHGNDVSLSLSLSLFLSLSPSLSFNSGI